MKKRVLATLLSLCLIVGLLPTGAIAVEAEEEPTSGNETDSTYDTSPTAVTAPLATQSIYVSETVGNDTNGAGMQENPYKTIQKAVSVASDSEVTQIWVMSDLTVSAAAAVGTKQIMLSSVEGQTCTLTVAAAVHMFTITGSGSVYISNVKITGSTTSNDDKHVVYGTGTNATITIGDGTEITGFHSAYGAVCVAGANSSLTWAKGSSIHDCSAAYGARLDA